MSRRRTRIAALKTLTAMTVLIAVAGCSSSRADFSHGSVAEVEQALERTGLKVCSRLTNTKGLANQAVSTTVLNVGVDCHEELVAVVIDRFENAADRDGAARSLEVQTRPRRDGVVWTYGPNTIAVFGPRDHTIMRKITRSLDGVGAR